MICSSGSFTSSPVQGVEWWRLITLFPMGTVFKLFEGQGKFQFLDPLFSPSDRYNFFGYSTHTLELALSYQASMISKLG